MKRANAFDVIPQSDEDEELLRRLLDASAALWNEINYPPRHTDVSVWVRGTRGPHSVRDVLETSSELSEF